jgi:hypothetical protein
MGMAQHPHYQKLERGSSSYPPAIYRPLVNAFWEFLQKSFDEDLTEG